MARIRTVKPELWTDPEFTECSLSARLLLIALLNFATDHGVLPDKPRQLKMQCLPADTIDIEPLIAELIDQHFLIRRTAPDGDKVLVIRTFAKNQRINRPTAGRWGDPADWPNPQPDVEADSVSTHGGLTEGRDNSDSSDSSEGDGSDDSEKEIANRRLSYPPSTEQTTTTTESKDSRFETVVELIVDAQVKHSKRPIANDAAYRGRCMNTLIREHGQTITTRLANRPDEPAALAARALALEIA